MGKNRYRRLCSAIQAAVLVSAVGSVSTALAQSESTGPALSMEEVRDCLCLQQEIDELRRETELQGSLRQDREAELSQVDQEIEQKRATIDVSDPAAVADLQQLVARQQMLRDVLRNDIRQSRQENAEALNARVAIYNEQCTTRPMFKLDVERAQANLQCPAGQ